MTAAATLAEVSKRFPGGAVALDRVSLAVPEGEILVLLGTSGSGKTTALKTINRLVAPDSGRVTVLGRDADGLGPDRAAPRHRLRDPGGGPAAPPHRAARTSGSCRGSWDGRPERREARARELLELVGLEPDRFAAAAPRAQLSGGERQRVGLAGPWRADPPLLLMDEPFGALDPLTRRRLQDEFKELQRRLGKTVVLVTHDVPEALRLGDQVAVMDRGRVVQAGRRAEIRDAPQAGFVADFVARRCRERAPVGRPS